MALQVTEARTETSCRIDFRTSQALSRIVVLLVGLVVSLGVSDLGLQVVMVLALKVLDSLPVAPLRVGINVHLNHAVSNRFLDVVHGGSRSSVENKHDGLFVLRRDVAEFLRDVFLSLLKNFGLELDVTRSLIWSSEGEYGTKWTMKAESSAQKNVRKRRERFQRRQRP